ncbi:hypothetical protein GM418_29780 [Maribellus comscasis]|uniref:Uncharacterized protein n=1 Tax=Maribellus comscasis TaxID=2681766 RepID=A0A6I6JX91_9BACT|nr:hypothetical protein [Maribellus comscasis]QGY47705.1 hypothetical protein GM418_29780 [Maribellus comscasis]
MNFSSSYSDTENNIQNYNCDDLANNALNKYSLNYLKTNFPSRKNYTIIPIKNLHDNRIIDTIYQFSENANNIEYYKGVYANFVTKFEVTNSKYALIV